MRLWSDIARLGEGAISQWLIDLVCTSAPLHAFVLTEPDRALDEVLQNNTCLYLTRDAIHPLFQVLRPYTPREMEFQEYFDVLQHAGESLVGWWCLFDRAEDCIKRRL